MKQSKKRAANAVTFISRWSTAICYSKTERKMEKKYMRGISRDTAEVKSLQR
jgi:hypothetical protein